MKKINLLLCLATVIGLSSCTTHVPPSSSSNEVKVSSVQINTNNAQIEELEILTGDSVILNGILNDQLTAPLTWESSNSEVVSVDENGKITALSKGDVIITVKVTNAPYISDSIIVHSSRKVEQTGVGSGKSANDPVFLGNEGEDEPIEIYFIEMQHIYGDSVFIKKGNVEVLIDAGYDYDGDYVNKVVTQYCADKRLDLLMASHSDGDHIDGLAKALSTVENISLMVDFGGQGTGNVLNARNKYKEKGMAYYSAYDSVNGLNGAVDRYYLTNELYFDVLNTGNYIKSDEKSAGNGNSLAVIFYYKDFTFFTGGDLTSGSELDLMKNEDLPEVTLYKSHHHGSHGSNEQKFLDKINPKAVAISASVAGTWGVTPNFPSETSTYNLDATKGHPAKEAIERIYKAPRISQNLNVYWNGVNGTMKFTSYGTDDFTFQGSKTMKGYYDLTKTNGVGVWNAELNDFENKITGEENFKLHETKVFQFRNYIDCLPQWAQNEYFPAN